MKIRAAVPADAPRVSGLLHSLSHTFTLSPSGEGAEAFFETISECAIATAISQENIVYLVAETHEGLLAGAAAMRDQRTLMHLFVDPAYQSAGLGSRLWEHLRDGALRAGNPGAFTVNSSIGAVPVYERFGFVVLGPRVEKHGGAYIPMALNMAPTPSDSGRPLSRELEYRCDGPVLWPTRVQAKVSFRYRRATAMRL